MPTFRIFDNAIGDTSFEVWVTDGLLQFVIDGEIRHDITSVSEFLTAAALLLNRPNGQDDSVIESSGGISDNAVENFQAGDGPVFDSGGTNPSISLQEDGTDVLISGGGVGGSFRADFGSGEAAQAEAATFLAFAEDLLGKATATFAETIENVQIGNSTRTVTVSTRDDDIQQIKFKSTGDVRDQGFADTFIDELGFGLKGERISNGNVSETGYTANQLNIDNDNPLQVNLGPQGVGGTERWVFGSEADALEFFNAVDAAFSPGGDRGAIINSAIEDIAYSLGGTQTRDGNVSANYEARQIKLFGEDLNFVTLGSHRVGGKETYEFDDQETAQKFIDLVRDAVGVEAQDGKLVDEFIYQVSGGAGIGGSPTFVGKDDFIDFIAEEFGGVQTRDGAVSESFSGGGRIIGDGTEVQLGPRGVGGREVWDFAEADDAVAFIATLDDLFG